MHVYLQYVNRAQKVGEIASDEELAWRGPVGLGTNRRLTAAFMPRTGDRIYLVSSLAAMTLPSLDALIVVDFDRPLYARRCRALAEAKTTVFPAGRGSRWLPMLDATALLESLEATTGPVLGKKIDKNGRQLSIVQRLQATRTMRCLNGASAQRIERWASENLTRSVFLSYRSKDGSKLAVAAARYLAEHGIPVWFDDWSISIRLDDLDWQNADDQLLANLRRQMEGCDSVVQIVTPEYGQSRWTALEREWASSSEVHTLTAESELPRLRRELLDTRATAD